MTQEWYQQFKVNGKYTTPKGFMNEKFFKQLSYVLPKELEGKNVLDLACNAGFVSFKLAGLGAHVIGFDKSEHYIDQANYIMKNTKVPKVRFIIADIEQLLLEAYSPHIIVLLSALYHLKDPASMVSKLCNTKADLVISLRNTNYDEYIKLFESHNMKIVRESTYGRKRASLIKRKDIC